MTNNLFSIIIPVYNTKASFFKKCLNSILKQTYKNWECLIIDDGSTNLDTLSILKKYKKEDKRFIILEQENQGQGSARNLGIINSIGNYITFLDSDDYLDINFLEISCKGNVLNRLFKTEMSITLLLFFARFPSGK